MTVVLPGFAFAYKLNVYSLYSLRNNSLYTIKVYHNNIPISESPPRSRRRHSQIFHQPHPSFPPYVYAPIYSSHSRSELYHPIFSLSTTRESKVRSDPPIPASYTHENKLVKKTFLLSPRRLEFLRRPYRNARACAAAAGFRCKYVNVCVCVVN